jgi:hypothetical protein
VFVAQGTHMTGRRRNQRFALSSQETGVLEVLEDVVMESGDGGQFVITSRTAPVVGHEATLHVADAAGAWSIRVRVVESRLHVVKGEMRHRVRLACLEEGPAPDAEGLVK